MNEWPDPTAFTGPVLSATTRCTSATLAGWATYDGVAVTLPAQLLQVFTAPR